MIDFFRIRDKLSNNKMENDYYDFTDICISPNGKWLVTSIHADDDNICDIDFKSTYLVKIWNISERILVKKLHIKYIKALKFSPDNKYLLCINNSKIDVWDTQTWNIIKVINSENPIDIVFTADKSNFIMVEKRKMYTYTMPDFKLIKKIDMADYIY